MRTIRFVKCKKKVLTNENKTNEVSNEKFTKTNEKTNGVRAFILSLILLIKMNYTKLKINIQYVIKRSDPALVVYI